MKAFCQYNVDATEKEDGGGTDDDDDAGAVLHYMSQYSFCWDSVGMDIKDLESVGMDPNRSAPLRASTSPPPPLAYFQHIKLSVPKRKA